MNRVKNLFSQYSIEIFLFLSAFFIRFPFFFRDYIDKDESTFILMGQSVSEGYLPYDRLWDLKPPLLFYFFALIEKIFPHSFFAIRFFGTVIIFLSAVLLWKIAKQAGLKNGFLIAIGYVLLSSEFGSLQGVMSEHFAVFFLLLGFYFFNRKKKLLDFFIAGLAFGCAVLCKLNYAYAITALLIYYLITQKQEGKEVFRSFLFSSVGILLPVLITAVPFFVEGKSEIFFNSVFLAPLKYAKALQYSMLEKIKVTAWVILLVTVISLLAIRKVDRTSRHVVFYMVAILSGTVYTFFSSGIVNGHYLVQIYPFLLMLVFGIILQFEFRLKLSVVAIAVFLLSFESVAEYYRLFIGLKDPAEYRPTFEVIRELKKRNLDDDKIFFADYHIGYWLLDKYPLTKSTTHPSNLGRSFLFQYYNDPNKTSLDELKYIMDGIKPEVVVSDADDLDFFPDSSLENKYFKKTISENFEMIYKDTTDQIFIWERENKK